MRINETPQFGKMKFRNAGYTDIYFKKSVDCRKQVESVEYKTQFLNILFFVNIMEDICLNHSSCSGNSIDLTFYFLIARYFCRSASSVIITE